MESEIGGHCVKNERSWFYYLSLVIRIYLGIKDINDTYMDTVKFTVYKQNFAKTSIQFLATNKPQNQTVKQFWKRSQTSLGLLDAKVEEKKGTMTCPTSHQELAAVGLQPEPLALQ